MSLRERSCLSQDIVDLTHGGALAINRLECEQMCSCTSTVSPVGGASNDITSGVLCKKHTVLTGPDQFEV